MVNLKEHENKITEVKQHIENSRGEQRKQFIKHLHRLQKQLLECKMYLKEVR